jgi:hypothetical protein
MHIVIENAITFPEDARDTFAGYFASHGAPSDNVDDTLVEDTYIALIYRTVELVEQGLRERDYEGYFAGSNVRPRAKVVCGVDEVVMKIEVAGLRVKLRVNCDGTLTVSVKKRGPGNSGSAFTNVDREPGTSALDDVVDRALTSWDLGAPDYNNHSCEQD